MLESVLDDADAQPGDPLAERLGIGMGLGARLARIEPARPGDGFE